MKKTIRLTESDLRKMVMEEIEKFDRNTINEIFHKGQEISLSDFIEDRKKSYEGRPDWEWNDEGIVYAVMDYYGSMGEFTPEDMETLEMYFGDDAANIIALCEESENEGMNESKKRKTNKKTIRLTESDLHRIVKESLKKMLNENKSIQYEELYDKIIDVTTEVDAFCMPFLMENGITTATNKHIQN